jgi:cellulose 1,4-beta-cellobiosidase
VANSWNSGFSGNIKIKNSSSTAINGWSLAFSFANDQTVTQGWSGTWSQSGKNVAVSNAAWNGSLAAGGTVDIGFNGSHTGTNTSPTSFALNGTTCAVS